MLKEFVSNLKNIFTDSKGRHRCFKREMDGVFQEIVAMLQQEIERILYCESPKNSPLHKHQVPKLKLLYAVKPIVIIPLLTILNCMVSYKICLNTSLTLRSRF